jgi:DNA-binding transcriptional ArsR family regulator
MDDEMTRMFKALSSTTRINMLKILANGEMHISGLAKELNISVPVVAKHAKILEDGGLIERKKFGRTHVLRAKMEMFYDMSGAFREPISTEVPKGSSILDALKAVSGVSVKRVNDKEFVTSIDGEMGYYIYEVNGTYPNVPMDEYELKKDVKLELKRLVPIAEKKIEIIVR